MSRSSSSSTQVRAGQPARTSALSGAGLDFRVWDAFHLGVAVVATAQVWTDGTPSVPARVLATVALAVLVAAYVVRGRELATVHAEATGPGLRYVAVIAVAYLVAVGASEPAAWALASMCVQTLLVLRWRVAVPCIAALSLVEMLTNVLVRHSTDGVAGLLGLAAATTVGSALLSAWIDQVAAQSDERARLLGELEASRGEVARLSHETGVLTERARLRAEIHDTLAQGYTSILALVQAAQQTADRGRATSLLDLAATTCRENLAEARAIVAAAPPPSLAPVDPVDPNGSTALVDALGRLVARLEAEAGVRARLVTTVLPGAVGGGDSTEGFASLDRALEVTVLRVTQEALTNIRKHARAHEVVVELTAEPEWLTLVVRDDGVGLGASTDPGGDGIDAGAPEGSSGGFGVGGMRARVEELGGTLDLADAVGGGTELRVEVPR